MESILSLAKYILEDPINNFSLTYIQLKSVLENSISKDNWNDIVTEYTSDTNALILLLKASYPLLSEQNMKNKLHYLIKKLKTDPPTPVALQSILSNETPSSSSTSNRFTNKH